MADDIEQLIHASANEDLDALEERPTQQQALRFHRPLTVVLGWVVCLMIAAYMVTHPLAEQSSVGSKGLATKLSISIYHVAHRIETYRQFTGHLPDYLDPAWQESQAVDYQLTDAGYELVGKSGDLTITYQQGDDAEALIHYFGRQGAQR